MCIIHFIGTNQKLDEVKFDKNRPSFWIEKFNKEKLASFQIGKSYTYIVGTSEGCGCKFGTEQIPKEILNKAKRELNNGKEYSRDVQRFFDWQETEEQLNESYIEHSKYSTDTIKLLQLLESISEKEDNVEFFGSWAEDEKSKELIEKEFNKNELRVTLNWEEFVNHPIKIRIKNE